MHLYSATSWASPRLDVEAERQVFARGLEMLVAIFARAARRGELIDEAPATCARLYLAALQVLLGEWEREGLAQTPDEIAARLERLVTRTFARAAVPLKPRRRA
jgi:hypothetical protein